MSLLHPSRITRSLIKIASFGLAGLLAGLLSGCSSNTLLSHNDTDWQTSSTYASATSSVPPSSALRSPHPHVCYAAPCDVHPQPSHQVSYRRP